MRADLPGFPHQVPLRSRTFENWSRMIHVAGLPVCFPASESDILQVVNWAATSGYRVRPVGAGHTWAPFVVDPHDARPVLLVDQTRLAGLVDFAADPVPRATFLPGTTLADATRLLEETDNGGLGEAPGWAWTNYPGIPDVTLGGMTAIAAHGAGIRTHTDEPDLFGTFSNQILALRAVVWDSAANEYRIREFDRSEAEIAALMVHLGRAFLTALTLRVIPNYYLHRQVHYPDWHEVFAPPATELPSASVARTVAKHSRMQQLWFPFTQTPVVQTMTETQHPDGPMVSKPLTVRLSPSLPKVFTTAYTALLSHVPALTPMVDRAVLAEMRHLSPPDHDWYGTSRNILLYVPHDTLRVISLAYAIVVESDAVQEVVHALALQFEEMLERYARAGHDPISSCLELRVTDVDRPDDVGVPDAQEPALSPARPLRGSNAQRVVWFDVVTTPGTPKSNEFYAEYEDWLWRRWPEKGVLRAEWSKAWAFTSEGPWTNEEVLRRISDSYSDASSSAMATAGATLRGFDPRGVFSTPLLDRLLGV